MMLIGCWVPTLAKLGGRNWGISTIARAQHAGLLFEKGGSHLELSSPRTTLVGLLWLLEVLYTGDFKH